MSLQDLEHQIETAALVSAKLEDDAKSSSKGQFPSRVRSGIRKEFSAFRKVLEDSKSRLQGLQAMQETLEGLEEPIPSPKLAKSPLKKVAISPHWLPSLGRKKKFFRDKESRDAIKEARQDDAERSGSPCANGSQREGPSATAKPVSPSRTTVTLKGKFAPRHQSRDWNLPIDPIHEEFTVIKSESDGSSTADDNKAQVKTGRVSSDVVPGEDPSLSLAARERSFRSNLQARALAMSKSNRSALSREQSTKSKIHSMSKENDGDNNGQRLANGGSSSSDESLTLFASRLEKSIRMMTTVEILAAVDSREEDLPTITTLDDLVRKPWEEVIIEQNKDIPSPSFKKVSSFSLRRLTFNDQDNEDKAIGDNSPMPVTPSNLHHTNSIKKKISFARAKSFHTDGWKETMAEDATLETLTEEDIAAMELQAREAYIKAMHAHQMLLKCSKDKLSQEVLASQTHLQACFQKIEYWEIMKDEFNANPSAFSPQVIPQPPDQKESISAAADSSAAHISSFCPQDGCYVGEQELKAREAYIKAMRHHQNLVSARVKHTSVEWIESQKNQQQCLAKLQFWESKNTGNEPAFISESSAGNRNHGEPASFKKSVYRVSLENKEDQKGAESLLESLAKSVKAKYFNEEEDYMEASTRMGSTGAYPEGVLSSQDSEISQQDDNIMATACEALYAVAFPCCVDSIGHQYSSDDAGTGHSDSYNPSSKRKSKGTGKKANKSKAKANQDGRQSSQKTSKSKSETMNVIESQAKEILGHLSFDDSASEEGDGGHSSRSPVADTQNSPEDPSDKEDLFAADAVPTLVRVRKSREGLQIPTDDMSDVSKLIEEEGGGVHLFCR